MALVLWPLEQAREWGDESDLGDYINLAAVTEGEMGGGVWGGVGWAEGRNGLKKEWLNNNELGERNRSFNINLSLQEYLILESE